MRIAVSGSHGTGKSTLVRELASHLAGYESVDEPWHLLDADGHVFADPPAGDDFIALLDHAAALSARHATRDILFDRSAVDYLAYLAAVSPELVHAEHIVTTADALATMDLVVLVPVERPDRVEAAEAPKLRRRVDQVLHEMLVERAWPFSARVLEVSGSVDDRMQQVLREVGRGNDSWSRAP